MGKNELAEYLRTTPLAQLQEAFAILADRCYRERVRNRGRVPKEIFESCIGIGGNYPCAQIIVEVVDASRKRIGYALRRRDSTESGVEWQGQYHNVCTAVRMGETADDVFARDFSDIFGETPPLEHLEDVGASLPSEPERRADAVTTIWKIQILENEIPNLVGTWKLFTNWHHPSVIDHMQAILDWASNPSRKRYFRTFTKIRES